MKELEEFKFNLNEVKKIADERSEEEMSRLRSKARKRLEDVQRRLDDVQRDSQNFEEAITPESSAMDKYSQRIYEQVQETVDRVEIPENITLKTLEDYITSLRDALSDQDEVLIKYVKLLKSAKYKGRVKSLDRSLKRLNKDLKKLEDFVKNEYAPSADIEKAGGLINETIVYLDEYAEKYDDLMQKAPEVQQQLEDIKKITDKLDNLKNHPIRKEHQEALEEYKTAQREIDFAFSNIRKVFRKYEKYVSKNGKNVDTTLLSNLVTDAASTMGHQRSYGNIESLLKEIYEVLDDTALNLNRDKRETAKDDIEMFLDGKLNELYTKARKIITTKEQKERELEEMNLDSKIETVERNLAASLRDKNRIYRRELRYVDRIVDDIEKNVNEINKRMSNMGHSSVELKLLLPDLPEWVDSEE